MKFTDKYEIIKPYRLSRTWSSTDKAMNSSFSAIDGLVENK